MAHLKPTNSQRTKMVILVLIVPTWMMACLLSFLPLMLLTGMNPRMEAGDSEFSIGWSALLVAGISAQTGLILSGVESLLLSTMPLGKLKWVGVSVAGWAVGGGLGALIYFGMVYVAPTVFANSWLPIVVVSTTIGIVASCAQTWFLRRVIRSPLWWATGYLSGLLASGIVGLYLDSVAKGVVREYFDPSWSYLAMAVIWGIVDYGRLVYLEGALLRRVAR